MSLPKQAQVVFMAVTYNGIFLPVLVRYYHLLVDVSFRNYL